MTTKFPLNGHADTCLGFDGVEHGTDAELTQGLCPACDAALTASVKQNYVIARLSAKCGNCTDHAHGARYYDCMCCYGD